MILDGTATAAKQLLATARSPAVCQDSVEGFQDKIETKIGSYLFYNRKFNFYAFSEHSMILEGTATATKQLLATARSPAVYQDSLERSHDMI